MMRMDRVIQASKSFFVDPLVKMDSGRFN